MTMNPVTPKFNTDSVILKQVLAALKTALKQWELVSDENRGAVGYPWLSDGGDPESLRWQQLRDLHNSHCENIDRI